MSNSRSSHPFYRLMQYASDYRSRVYRGVLYSVVNKLFDLAPPMLIGAAVDIVVSQRDSFVARLGITDVSTQLWALAGVTLVIWMCESLFEYFASVTWRNLAQDLQHRLRIELFSHMQGLDMSFFESRSTGQLMSVLNDDINQLERFLDVGAHEILLLLTTILVIGGVFIGVVPDVAWMTLAPMPIIAFCSVRFQRIIAPRYESVRAQAGEINAHLANTIQGIATVKSFTTESYEQNLLEQESLEYQRRNTKAIALSSSFVPLIRMLVVVGFAAILVFAGEKAIAGELNVGAYSVLVFMTQRLLWPLTRLGTTMDLYYRALASAKRVLLLFEIEPGITDASVETMSPEQSELDKVYDEITFKNVSFSYPERENVITSLGFSVAGGTTIGVVGATGSGKTTIVKLLLRYYQPNAGDIALNGCAIERIPLATLRKNIAVVSQDVFLVDGSVAENIRYGSFQASDDAVRRAAEFAEIHEFIESLPQGYETRVGERGQRLSGGQRQRIAIARAMIKDAPILILDEATSAVDNETEAAIQRALYKLMGKKTIIIIAHRLSTVRHADEIVVLERGAVVQRGTHDELSASSGVYRSLWDVQTGISAHFDANQSNV